MFYQWLCYSDKAKEFHSSDYSTSAKLKELIAKLKSSGYDESTDAGWQKRLQDIASSNSDVKRIELQGNGPTDFRNLLGSDYIWMGCTGNVVADPRAASERGSDGTYAIMVYGQFFQRDAPGVLDLPPAVGSVDASNASMSGVSSDCVRALSKVQFFSAPNGFKRVGDPNKIEGRKLVFPGQGFDFSDSVVNNYVPNHLDGFKVDTTAPIILPSGNAAGPGQLFVLGANGTRSTQKDGPGTVVNFSGGSVGDLNGNFGPWGNLTQNIPATISDLQTYFQTTHGAIATSTPTMENVSLDHLSLPPKRIEFPTSNGKLIRVDLGGLSRGL